MLRLSLQERNCLEVWQGPLALSKNLGPRTTLHNSGDQVLHGWGLNCPYQSPVLPIPKAVILGSDSGPVWVFPDTEGSCCFVPGLRKLNRVQALLPGMGCLHQIGRWLGAGTQVLKWGYTLEDGDNPYSQLRQFCTVFHGLHLKCLHNHYKRLRELRGKRIPALSGRGSWGQVRWAPGGTKEEEHDWEREGWWCAGVLCEGQL